MHACTARGLLQGTQIKELIALVVRSRLYGGATTSSPYCCTDKRMPKRIHLLKAVCLQCTKPRSVKCHSAAVQVVQLRRTLVQHSCRYAPGVGHTRAPTRRLHNIALAVPTQQEKQRSSFAQSNTGNGTPVATAPRGHLTAIERESC